MMALSREIEKPGKASLNPTPARYHRKIAMKCNPEDMVVFELDYGDLLRPDFQILPSRGWAQCTNRTDELLIVYGPKHPEERSIFDTSPYVLEPDCTTPDGWDCKGFFLPADRTMRFRRGTRPGPLAIKYWNHRRFPVSRGNVNSYRCPWSNGVFEPSQINWAIPNFSYQQILERIGRRVR